MPKPSEKRAKVEGAGSPLSSLFPINNGVKFTGIRRSSFTPQSSKLDASWPPGVIYAKPRSSSAQLTRTDMEFSRPSKSPSAGLRKVRTSATSLRSKTLPLAKGKQATTFDGSLPDINTYRSKEDLLSQDTPGHTVVVPSLAPDGSLSVVSTDPGVGPGGCLPSDGPRQGDRHREAQLSQRQLDQISRDLAKMVEHYLPLTPRYICILYNSTVAFQI